MSLLVAWCLGVDSFSAEPLSCKIVRWSSTLRCNCPTTFVQCSDGREGYVFNQDFEPELSENSEGQTLSPKVNPLNVWATGANTITGNNSLIGQVAPPRYQYANLDGKGIASPQGAGIMHGQVDPKNSECTKAPGQKKRVWPGICAGNVRNTETQKSNLIICQTIGADNCPDAVSCANNAAWKNKEFGITETKVSIAETVQGHSWSSTQAVIVSPKITDADSGKFVAQPICVGRVEGPHGPMIGAGPVGEDGSCHISDMVTDSCFVMQDFKNSTDLTPYPAPQPEATPVKKHKWFKR
jgi:hypothetical protein